MVLNKNWPATAAGFVAATALSGFVATASTAHAAEYQFGDVSVSTATTVSAGTSLRAAKRDCSRVNPANGGCNLSNGGTTSINADNGNLNFNQWDFTSAAVKATTDVQASYENYGAFVRVKAFYDWVYANNDLRFRDLAHDGKEQLDYGVDLLDAYVYGDFYIGESAVSVRAGNQVLNWGESLFQQGGINAFQPVDLTALRTPGAELKEGLTPMPMVSGSATFGDSSVEAFWQWEWEKTTLDPSGTIFQNTDTLGAGGFPGLLQAPDSLTSPVRLPIAEDNVGSDTSQFGVAFRHYAQDINGGTEFGLYYTRYTSRLPFIGYRFGIDAATACGLVPGGCVNPAAVQTAIGIAANTMQVTWNYPDQIDNFGFSLSTLVGDTAVAGEVVYTPQMPLATASNEQLAQALDRTGFSNILAGGLHQASRLPNTTGSNISTSFVEEQVIQGQMSTISTLSQSNEIVSFIDADSIAVLTNAGFMYAPYAGNFPLNRSGSIFGIQDPVAAAVLTPGVGVPVTNVQYATSLSTGYRVSLISTYSNAFDLPVTLTPSIAFRHDVSGYSPGPIGPGFMKGSKSINLSVGFEYLSDWRGQIGYTNFFGGGVYNANEDRDFVSASVSYAF